MPTHEKNFKEQILTIAGQTGLKFSDVQLGILDVFSETSEHTDAQGLARRCGARGMEVEPAAAAAMLDTLCRLGAALKHEFKINNTAVIVYEHLHLGQHHDHFTCVKCGAIRDFFDPTLEKVQDEICRTHGFTQLRHLTEIYGICDQCRGRREPVLPLSLASRGERFVVREIRGGGMVKRRLTDMGLNPGVEIEVMNADQPMLIAVRDTRLALGAGLAGKIMVSYVQN